mmetsp:Transcript_64411/g.179113  ORF Transcript_64411/g.179113 Transcript_64411/m.179113 type:complete len:248 (-) Transcript_64411:558-1301(-)
MSTSSCVASSDSSIPALDWRNFDTSGTSARDIAPSTSSALLRVVPSALLLVKGLRSPIACSMLSHVAVGAPSFVRRPRYPWQSPSTEQGRGSRNGAFSTLCRISQGVLSLGRHTTSPRKIRRGVRERGGGDAASLDKVCTSASKPFGGSTCTCAATSAPWRDSACPCGVESLGQGAAFTQPACCNCSSLGTGGHIAPEQSCPNNQAVAPRRPSMQAQRRGQGASVRTSTLGPKVCTHRQAAAPDSTM